MKKRMPTIGMTGKHHSEETRLKMRLARLGTKLSMETRVKISISRAGKGLGPCSEEKKEKIGTRNALVGERKLMKNGYIRLTVSTYPMYQRPYEHRYIVEEYLGRKLEYNENIHHINHDRTDNRLENLKIIDKREHNRIHALEMVAAGRHNGKFQ